MYKPIRMDMVAFAVPRFYVQMELRASQLPLLKRLSFCVKLDLMKVYCFSASYQRIAQI